MTEENQEVENQEEVNLNEVIREAFDGSIAEEAEEDSIKMNMIAAGATFKNVTRLYNQFMIDAGLAISKEDRNKAVEDTLSGKPLDSEGDFDAAVEDVMEAVTGSTERSAAAIVRAYAKKNELECYAKPKSEGTSVDINTKVCEFIIDKEAYDEPAVVEFIKSCKDGLSDGALRTYMRHAKRTHAYGLKLLALQK